MPDNELRETAMWVLEETTGMSRAEILCKDTTNIPNLEIILERLRSGMPLQYVFGKAYWGGLTLHVNSHTLIPRPETWGLVEAVRERFQNSEALHVLDIGTGSGCIAIALKRCFPHWHVEACDISQEAIETARQNAGANNAEIRFFQLDILKEETDYYDIIVSNPPYVMESEKAGMQKRVLDFEPESALFVPDSDPLLFYRRIASLQKAHSLFFEINEQAGETMREMLAGQGYINISVIPDMAGKDRIVAADKQ